jgi:hypothetical protein
VEIRRPPQLRHHATRLRSYLPPQEAYVRREITEQTDPENRLIPRKWLGIWRG